MDGVVSVVKLLGIEPSWPLTLDERQEFFTLDERQEFFTLDERQEFFTLDERQEFFGEEMGNCSEEDYQEALRNASGDEVGYCLRCGERDFIVLEGEDWGTGYYICDKC